jgi:hypothetical protein
MKKLIALIAACILLFCGCSASDAYVTQLESKAAALETQLADAKKELADAKKALTAAEEKQKAAAAQEMAAQAASRETLASDASPTKGAAAVTSGTGDVIVYITKSGKKYHCAGCRSLSKSCIAITLAEAKKKGYTPCGSCHPPE